MKISQALSQMSQSHAMVPHLPINIRETIRQSYLHHRHYSSLPAGTPPHRAGLHGALGDYYRLRGIAVRELILWVELPPFLLMKESVGSAALIEYILYQEFPAEAQVSRLRSVISAALRPPASSYDSPRAMAPLALLKGIAWCRLLEPDVKFALERDARSLAVALNDNNLPSPGD